MLQIGRHIVQMLAAFIIILTYSAKLFTCTIFQIYITRTDTGILPDTHTHAYARTHTHVVLFNYFSLGQLKIVTTLVIRKFPFSNSISHKIKLKSYGNSFEISVIKDY